MSANVNNKVTADLMESKTKSLRLPKCWIPVAAATDVILSLVYCVI